MTDTKFRNLSSILFSNEITNFGVYRYQGIFFTALIRNIALWFYISHILLNNTFKFIEVFDSKILSIIFVYSAMMGIIISFLNIFFFLMAIFQDETANNLFPVLGRKSTPSFKKLIIGFIYVLSFILCVDSLVSWLFMSNLTFESKENNTEKVYHAAAPNQLSMEETFNDVTLDVEITNTVWRS
jgi:hypothetical protein